MLVSDYDLKIKVLKTNHKYTLVEESNTPRDKMINYI